MKFGKSIVAEARNNRGLAYIDFKNLKKLLKLNAKHESLNKKSKLFAEALQYELNKVDENFWKEYESISALQKTFEAKLPSLEFYPDPATFTDMTFEQLLSHLQGFGGLSNIYRNPDAATSAKTIAALCEFCVSLGKISAKCQRLRRCVLWNAVATVKILKKRQKMNADTQYDTAATILSKQYWYSTPALSRIISLVEVTTDELMQHLTQKAPNRDRYQCPICLDVVIDPVCLKTCGHRFCWACLCMAYCERPEGTLERCPCCRAAFPLDPEAFEIDGILSRFLRSFFPDIQNKRVSEQKENIKRRLNAMNISKEAPIPCYCCPDCEPSKKICSHVKNVREGKPADIIALNYSKCEEDSKIEYSNQHYILPLQVRAVVDSLLDDMTVKPDSQRRLVTMLQQHITNENQQIITNSKIQNYQTNTTTLLDDFELPELVKENSQILYDFQIIRPRYSSVQPEYEAVDAEDDEIEDFINSQRSQYYEI